MEINLILFELLNAVNNYKLCLRVICLIKTSISIVSGINSTCDAIVNDAAHERYGPLWSIVTHYVNWFSLIDTKSVHRLRECKCFSAVILPCPFQFFSSSLDINGRSFWHFDCSLNEYLTQGFGLECCVSCLTHLNGQFYIDVRSPEDVLSILSSK